MDIVQLKEVTKEFGNRIVLDKVSFSIREGDIFGIIGQSGSGKTTLLNLLIGFHELDEGEILYQWDKNRSSRNLCKNIKEIRKKIGFCNPRQLFLF